MNHLNNPNRQPIPRSHRRSNALRTAAGAAAIVAVAGVSAKAADTVSDFFDKVPGAHLEQEAIDRFKTEGANASTDMVVLYPGVTVRKTPQVPKFSREPDADNAAFKVKQGQVLSINHAVSTGDGWIAFQLDGTDLGDEPSAQKIADNTYWVNTDVVSDQTNSQGESFMQRYVSSEKSEPTVQVTMSENGHFYDQEQNIAAIGRQMDKAEFQFVVQNAGIQLAE